jgi:hypothetical protein
MAAVVSKALCLIYERYHELYERVKKDSSKELAKDRFKNVTKDFNSLLSLTSFIFFFISFEVEFAIFG